MNDPCLAYLENLDPLSPGARAVVIELQELGAAVVADDHNDQRRKRRELFISRSVPEPVKTRLRPHVNEICDWICRGYREARAMAGRGGH